MKQLLVHSILIFILLLIVPSSHSGVLPLDLTGFLDVSYGKVKFDSREQETYKQQYSVNWSKTYFENITLRSDYFYSKYDVLQNSDNSSWKEEQRPTIGLTWTNKHINLGSTASYKQDKSNSAILESNREDFSVFLKTLSEKYPKLTLRYYWDHIYNDELASARNTKENKFQAELHESYKRSLINYNFTRRKNNNQTNNVRTVQYQHSFQFGNTSHFKESRLLFTTNYTFVHSSQTDTRPVAGSDFIFIPYSEALYKETASILLDTLQRNPSLNDGNSDNPAQPSINIGGTAINQNLGIDFGYPEDVSAIYLYVDRFSDNTKDFHVYISNDNYNWTSYYTGPDVEFNEGYNRFEIVFPSVKTRYIKVVTSGISNFDPVLVTEIRALAKEQVDVDTKYKSTSHQLNVGSRYRFAENFQSSLNASFQHQSGRANDADRDNIYYALSSQYTQSDVVNHNFLWTQSYQLFNGAALDISSYTASYLLLLTPIQRLEFSFASNYQKDFIDYDENSNNLSFLLNTKGTPLTNLNFSGEVSYSKYNQLLGDDQFNTWNRRITLDGKITRTLSMILGWSYRSTDTRSLDTTTTQTLYRASFRYRMTRTIFMRGSIQLNKNRTKYMSEEFQLGWNPSTKLSLSGQVQTQDDDELFKTTKYNAQANYKLRGNTNIFASYFINDLTEAGGEKTTSVRVGIRSSL